jgi:amidase
MSVDHVVSISVRDSAAVLDATHGPDAGAPYYPPAPIRPYAQEITEPPKRLRIAVSSAPMLGASMDPVCAAAVEDAARLLEEMGHEVFEATLEIDPSEVGFHFAVLTAAATAVGITQAAAIAGRAPDPNLFEAGTWITGLAGRRLSAEDLATAIDFARNLGRRVAPFFEEVDVFVESVLARPPWPLGEMTLSHVERRTLDVIKRVPSRAVVRRVLQRFGVNALESIPNTPLWNVTGQPSMSVPLAWHDGLPIGVQFTARYGDEATLFRLAAQLEAARPWAHKVPEIVA